MNSVSSCLECFGPGMLLHYQEPGLILSVFHSLWRNQSSWLERLSICHTERAGDSPASQGRGRIWSTQMTWALGLTLRGLSRTAYFRTVQLQTHPCFLSLNLNRMSSQGSPKDWKPRRSLLLDWESQMSVESSGSVPLLPNQGVPTFVGERTTSVTWKVPLLSQQCIWSEYFKRNLFLLEASAAFIPRNNEISGT